MPISLSTFGNDEQNTRCDLVRGKLSLGHYMTRVQLLAHDRVDTVIQVSQLNRKARSMTKQGMFLKDKIYSHFLKNIEVVIGADDFTHFIEGHQYICGMSTFMTSAALLSYGPFPLWAQASSGSMNRVMARRVILDNRYDL